MKTGWIVLGFGPFIAFAVARRFLDVGVAAPIAGVVALFVVLLGLRRGPEVPAITATVAFATVGVAAHVDPRARPFLDSYADSLVTLLLAVVVLATLPFFPFTLTAARASVPDHLWHLPRFLATNRSISGAWGLAIAVAGTSDFGGELMTDDGLSVGHLHLILGSIIPVVAYLAAIRFTARTVRAVQIRADRDRPGLE